MVQSMTQSLGVVAFFLIVWGLGTYTQYRYWSRVRKLIHEIARDHAGYLGTGMCRIKFSRKAFILILADEEGVVTGGYEIKTLSATLFRRDTWPFGSFSRRCIRPYA